MWKIDFACALQTQRCAFWRASFEIVSMFRRDENAVMVEGVLLQVSILLLFCFLFSALWEGQLKLFSTLSSLKAMSASSSFSSGLRVSASGVWKLPGAERKKMLSAAPSSTHSHTHLLSVVFVAELVRSCSLLSSSSNGWRLMISTV